VLEARAGALVGLGLPKNSCPEPIIGTRAEHTLLEEAVRQLEAYFAGQRTRFELPLHAEGSPFRRRVWQALQSIPYGETRRYGELAEALGTAARAVGGACGANPIAIIVPCHRVVGGHGWLGGFSGGQGCATKRLLLELEATRNRLPLG
jgi:methylated-DNA-[protein]-cysteine S-methyltransferase